MADPASSQPARRRRWLAGALICAAAAAPYASTVDDYFVRDDFGVVQLLASKPASYFPRWFYTSWMDRIWGFLPDEVRPFPAVSYQLTALAGAGSPVAHHLFNIALHALNGLLVFALAINVARLALPAAAFAAVAFVLLPVHAESVAWITGRVDSMPALFYLASFYAYARWRDREGAGWYWGALALFFVALFTKQNTITMVATLAAYDLLVRRGLPGSPARTAAVYLPFVLLTAGYLALRFALFGQVAREASLSTAGLAEFARLAGRHLSHVVAGSPDASRVLVWALLAVVFAVCLIGGRGIEARRRVIGLVLFFGPVWWALGVAPVAVAGYESPRHVYLAAVGWAVLLGLALDVLIRERAVQGDRSPLRMPRLAALAVLAVVLFYAAQLRGAVRDWNQLALVSERAVRQLAADAAQAPRGTLFIAGVPGRSWEWALPFAAQPPFVEHALGGRSFIISPRELHCCRQQWFDDTRRALTAWAAGPGRDAVVLLRWDPETAALSRQSNEEQPALAPLARVLLDVRDADLLDSTIRRLLASAGGAGS